MKKITNQNRINGRTAACLIAATCLSTVAQAEKLYWILSGTAGGDWNESAFWSTSASGGSTGLYAKLAGEANEIIFPAGDSSIVMVQGVKPSQAVSRIRLEQGKITIQGVTSGRILPLTGDAEIDTAGKSVLTCNVKLAGSAGMTKTGTGTLEMGQAGGYTGSTRIKEGVMTVSKNDVIPDDNAVVIDAGATLTCAVGGGRQETVGSIAGAGTLVLKSAVVDAPAFTVGGDNRSTEFSGVIRSDNAIGWFIKTGTGALTLSGNNTYGQETRVTSGTLLVNGNSRKSSGKVLVSSGAALGGSGTIGGNVDFEKGAKFRFSKDPLTVGRKVTFEKLGVEDIVGLTADVTPGTYTLIAGTVDLTNVSNTSPADAADIGGGRKAYLSGEGLQLIIIK
jgi:autotransporter-associated beta strand protein